MEKTVERTDFSKPRLVAAVKSQNRYIALKRDFFKRFDGLLRQELCRTANPGELVKLRAAVEQNRTEEQIFEQSIKLSSLRARLKKGMKNQQTQAVIEHRYLGASDSLSMMSAPKKHDEGQIKICGLAAVFNSNSLNLGGFVERILPGAFTSALEKSDVRALVNHNTDLLLGRTASGTLRLNQIREGLLFWDDLPGSNDAITSHVVSRIERKDISGCSFSFIIRKDKWEFPRKEGQMDVRIIEEVEEIFDVGPVTFPAYESTSIQVIRVQDSSDIYTQEDFLRDQDKEDEILGEEIERKIRDRKREVESGYKKATRIRNRCLYALGHKK